MNHFHKRICYDKDNNYKIVSKWENGINLPEVTLIRQMSKDFDISVEDILDGKLTKKRKRKYLSKRSYKNLCKEKKYRVYTIKRFT